MEKLLQQIGLSGKEASIYITCLMLGPQPASNIARNIELNRPTVYDSLNSRLFNLREEDGLISNAGIIFL